MTVLIVTAASSSRPVTARRRRSTPLRRRERERHVADRTPRTRPTRASSSVTSRVTPAPVGRVAGRRRGRVVDARARGRRARRRSPRRRRPGDRRDRRVVRGEHVDDRSDAAAGSRPSTTTCTARSPGGTTPLSAGAGRGHEMARADDVVAQQRDRDDATDGRGGVAQRVGRRSSTAAARAQSAAAIVAPSGRSRAASTTARRRRDVRAPVQRSEIAATTRTVPNITTTRRPTRADAR